MLYVFFSMPGFTQADCVRFAIRRQCEFKEKKTITVERCIRLRIANNKLNSSLESRFWSMTSNLSKGVTDSKILLQQSYSSKVVSYGIIVESLNEKRKVEEEVRVRVVEVEPERKFQKLETRNRLKFETLGHRYYSVLRTVSHTVLTVLITQFGQECV